MAFESSAGTAAVPVADIPITSKAEQAISRLDTIAQRLRHIQDRIEGPRPSSVPLGAIDKVPEAPPLRRQITQIDHRTDDILGLVNSIESALFG